MTRFRSTPDHAVRGSLVEGLVEVVDDVRAIADELGVRPFRTFLVWVGWTADLDADGYLSAIRTSTDADLGSPEELLEAASELDLEDHEIGVGRAVLLKELELLPRPLVTVGGVGKSMDAVGLTERGGMTVTRISMRYSEDLLMGLVCPFRDPDRPNALRKGIDFFWEIREDRPAGFVSPGYEGEMDPQEKNPPRRRYHVTGVPSRVADAFQYSVALSRADGERGRDGEVP